MRTQRKHPRIDDQIPIKLSTHRGGECIALVLTRQISRGGCTIKGHHKPAPGSILEATLFVGGKCVSITSLVVHAEDRDGEQLTGLRFLSMAPGDLAALEEYIGRKVPPDADEGLERTVRDPLPA